AAELRTVGENLVNRFSDRGFVFRAVRFEHNAQPIADEGAVHRRALEAQRIETGWGAARDPLVAAAERAQENLRAAVLVEQHCARRELLRLSGEEVQDNGLARTRRADDREIAEVALVEVEEEGCRAGRPEDGHRIAPMVPARAAHGKAMKRDEAGSVRAGDERAADD